EQLLGAVLDVDECGHDAQDGQSVRRPAVQRVCDLCRSHGDRSVFWLLLHNAQGARRAFPPHAHQSQDTLPGTSDKETQNLDQSTTMPECLALFSGSTWIVIRASSTSALSIRSISSQMSCASDTLISPGTTR